MSIQSNLLQLSGAAGWSGGHPSFANDAAPDMVGLARRLGGPADAGTTPLLRQVLDALGFGLMLVDGEAHVLHANPAASLLCRAGAPLALRERRLCADAEGLARLAAAVRAAASGQWAMLVLGGEQAQLSVGVVPIVGAAGDDGEADEPGLVALLVIGSEHRSNRLALHFFARAHQLTAAESAVLEALSQGHSPSQIARQGGVAISTVRTQIATVRAKVNARSICHLLRMVATLPPLMGASIVTPS